AAIRSWLGFVAANDTLPKRMLLPFVTDDGPFARELAQALAERGAPHRRFASHVRALLAPADRPADAPANYLEASLTAKRQKELARQRRRLGDGGAVETEILAAPPAVAAGLDDYLALEAAGWKGRAGTAAAQNEAVRQFVRQALCGLAARRQVRIARLSVGVRPAAVGIVLLSGDTAWFWKIAYDETLSRASPGVQLTLDITRALLADAEVRRTDSCATEGHPMIDHVWRERLALSDHMIVLAGNAPLAFAAETARRRAIAFARAARNRIRGVRPAPATAGG
ncbi:MAG: GNAT family N-acetyltransferase, partial [Rhizobiales bacterium]|nr:GNAT family N-acetyltransferase [Hyphomicrobiales bacterium]